MHVMYLSLFPSSCRVVSKALLADALIHFISGDFNFFKPCSTDVDGKQSPKIIQVFDASYMPDAKGTRQYQSDVEISEVSVSVIDVS